MLTKAELEFLELVPMLLREISESLKVIADSVKEKDVEKSSTTLDK